MSDKKVIDVVVVGGESIEEGRTYTPAEYFDKIKSMKDNCKEEELQKVLDVALIQMNKFKLLKQTEAANICGRYIKMLEKEIKVIQAGFNTYVLKNDVEYYMNHVDDKCIFCCEIEDYPRVIPDEIADKIVDHIDLFDHIFIVFTDYTQKVAKEVKRKTKEKDPIMFGAFDIVKSSRPVVGPRFYYIGDWVDEFCDLTLEQLLDGCKGDNVLKTSTIPETSKNLTHNMAEYNDEIISVVSDNMIGINK